MFIRNEGTGIQISATSCTDQKNSKQSLGEWWELPMSFKLILMYSNICNKKGTLSCLPVVVVFISLFSRSVQTSSR